MKSILLNHTQIENKILRLSHQILENNFYEKHLFFVGLNVRGNMLCSKIVSILKPLFDGEIEYFTLSSKRNTNKEIEISDIDIFSSRSLNNKSVIVFDDVVDSGQTLMYAVSYITSFNPNKIQTVALIDRNHRKFPIKVDYVGLQVATTLHENVVVEFDESNPENSCAFLQ